jgi:hypothetical protein
VHQALERAVHGGDAELNRQLLAEQQRTNRLLQALLGFALGLLVVLLAATFWSVYGV